MPDLSSPVRAIPTDTGEEVSLSALRGRKVIVYFYPAAMTAGCTKQACDFTDSLESLLMLSARQEADGEGDAPWPPHYRKAPGEPQRAAPSRRRREAPLIEIARADREAEALAAAEAWKAGHPKAAEHLEPADVLVDRMRGSSSVGYRVRINLTHVPPKLRPKA